MAEGLKQIIDSTNLYNFHAHTQFCDGRDSMEDIARAASEADLKYFGFSPHSPVPIDSPCNMDKDSLPDFYEENARLKELYAEKMRIMTSMEIDWLGAEWGPHIDFFQRQPLDYRIGSVHFVPNQDGVLLDCDGSFERFSRYLKDGYAGDLRYVVEKYFEQVLCMMERGGFELLGHFDKIAGNASQADPLIENEGWYEALIDDVVSHAKSSGVIVEINTKAFDTRQRFYPAERWWKKLIDAGISLAIDSDAHYASKVVNGRNEALERLKSLAPS
ncbi:MAG: histidinol-phosphatase [Muribaculaceae bacterium]|nr:histidinol-phosphatase [Muribaculaceae bacterium]